MMKSIQDIFNTYKSVKVEVKAVLWYTICNILQKGISFLVVPIYIRVLSTNEYGRYAIFLSWKDILLIFATFNLFYGVYTKSLVEFSDDKDRLTSSMQGLCTIITVIFSIVFLFINLLFGKILQYSNYVIALLILFYLFAPAYMFWTAKMRVEYKYVRMVVVTLLVSVMIPVSGLFLLKVTDLRESAVITGNLIIQIVAGVICYAFNMIKGKAFYNKKYWIKAIKFNLPLIPYYLSTMVLGQSDRIMIEKYDSTDKAGIYSLSYQIAFMLNVVTDAINASMTPWFYSRLKNKAYSAIKKISSTLLSFVVLLVVFVIFAAPDIIHFLGTDEYYQAVWIIPSVSICALFIFGYNLVVNIEFFYDMPHYITITTLLGAVLNILLNRILIPVYGFIAAGYTTAISYFLVFLLHYLVYDNLKRTKMYNNSPIDRRYVLASCLVTILVSAFSLFIYSQSDIWRYLLMISIIFGLFANKNKVKQIFSFLKNKELEQ